MRRYPLVYTLAGMIAFSALSWLLVWLFLCHFVSAFFPKG